MVGALSVAKERLPAWDQAEELVALDRLRFQHLHRVIYAHRQRVENAESYYDALETERQAEVMHARAEAMRVSRAKRKEEAVDSLKRDNQRMVERLCLVMKDSESRQHQLAAKVSKPPGSAPAGSLNLGFRRRAARQIDQDNKVLLDRLIRIGPTVSTRAELESRYQVYSTLVHRHSRLRRPLHKADVFRIPPPPIRAPRNLKRKALEARPSKGAKSSGGSKEEESSVKTAEESSGRRKTSTPEPLKSAKQAARTELEKVNQNVLHKINSQGEVSQGARGDPDEHEDPRQVETPEPLRAQKVAHAELERMEERVLQKIRSEGKMPGDSNDEDAEYPPDFEDDEVAKEKGKARPEVDESQEYEDDYEPEEAEDYSDVFEDEADSSRITSRQPSPKKGPKKEPERSESEMEDDFEPESEEGDADEYDNEPFERVASSEKSEKPSEEHNSSVPSLPGSAPSMHNEAPAPSHLTHVASDPVDEQHEDVNELTNEEDVNELHEDVKEEEALHEEEIHEDPTEEDVEASNDYEEDFEDLHSFASNAPNASNVPTHTAADSPPSTASAASGGAAGGVAQPKRWTQDFEDDEEEHGS
ncbi:Uncharacterized protein SCF082_LOCUS4580 [Durusdinium trenchii]|uniref:Uncharacterized protein n=1 Tax=Durusdinium trenchii TaxID=1381693 RepID=A0ABP0I3T5_9DINO